jgi:hypothetical protein
MPEENRISQWRAQFKFQALKAGEEKMEAKD